MFCPPASPGRPDRAAGRARLTCQGRYSIIGRAVASEQQATLQVITPGDSLTYPIPIPPVVPVPPPHGENPVGCSTAARARPGRPGRGVPGDRFPGGESRCAEHPLPARWHAVPAGYRGPHPDLGGHHGRCGALDGPFPLCARRRPRIHHLQRPVAPG